MSMLRWLRRRLFGESFAEIMHRVTAENEARAFTGPDGQRYVTWNREASRKRILGKDA